MQREPAQPSTGQASPVSTETAVVGRRRGKQWRPVGFGLHRLRDQAVDGDTGAADGRPPPALRADLLAWRLLLPSSGCFTHLTGAILRGWWLPPLPCSLPVFVSQWEGDPRMCRPQERVSRHPMPPAIESLDGIPVASAEEILLACARDLSLVDLVVLVDSALHCGDTTKDRLSAHADQRRRGAPRLRRAIQLADERSESAWETLLRRLHESFGVAVEPQHELFDDDGVFVAKGDLWLIGTSMLHEYDGGDHLARRQQNKDLRRARRIGNQAWQRRGFTSDNVLRRSAA